MKKIIIITGLLFCVLALNAQETKTNLKVQLGIGYPVNFAELKNAPLYRVSSDIHLSGKHYLKFHFDAFSSAIENSINTIDYIHTDFYQVIGLGYSYYFIESSKFDVSASLNLNYTKVNQTHLLETSQWGDYFQWEPGVINTFGFSPNLKIDYKISNKLFIGLNGNVYAYAYKMEKLMYSANIHLGFNL